MSSPVPLRCQCGAVQGELDVSASAGNRCVCYCDDCQTFAAALGREDILDAWGGSDIYQTAPNRLRITQGVEELRALRLGPKGLVRWYTACCKTPVGNMVSTTRSPFIGVISSFFPLDGPGRDAGLGPVRMHIMGRFARGGCPPHAHPKMPLSALPGFAGILLRSVLTGGHSPSPFVIDGAWRVEPELLSPEARAKLSAAAPTP